VTVRRLKAYTAATGFVYQYYFVGQRPAEDATEYIFDVTADRKRYFPISILLPRQCVVTWNAAHQRDLIGAEQYAAAKLRLMRAFDELDNLEQQGSRLTLDAILLDALLTGLGVD
jgi:hypothetical protein